NGTRIENKATRRFTLRKVVIAAQHVTCLCVDVHNPVLARLLPQQTEFPCGQKGLSIRKPHSLAVVEHRMTTTFGQRSARAAKGDLLIDAADKRLGQERRGNSPVL